MQKNETIAKAELSGYGRFRWVAVVAYDDGSEYDRREFSSGFAALDWLSSFGIPVEPKNQVAERELTAYKNAFDATNPAEITVLGMKVQTPFGTFRLGEIVRYDCFCFAVGEGILGKIERDGVRAIGKWATYLEESGFDTLVDWAEGGPNLIRRARRSPRVTSTGGYRSTTSARPAMSNIQQIDKDKLREIAISVSKAGGYSSEGDLVGEQAAWEEAYRQAVAFPQASDGTAQAPEYKTVEADSVMHLDVALNHYALEGFRYVDTLRSLHAGRITVLMVREAQR